MIKKFHKNKNYAYTEIEKYAIKHGLDITEIGRNVLYENFIIVSHETKDLKASFMLIAATYMTYIYKCLYNDLP